MLEVDIASRRWYTFGLCILIDDRKWYIRSIPCKLVLASVTSIAHHDAAHAGVDQI